MTGWRLYVCPDCGIEFSTQLELPDPPNICAGLDEHIPPPAFPVAAWLFGPPVALGMLAYLSFHSLTVVGLVAAVIFLFVMGLTGLVWTPIMAVWMRRRLRVGKDTGGWSTSDVLLRGLLVGVVVAIGSWLILARLLGGVAAAGSP